MASAAVGAGVVDLLLKAGASTDDLMKMLGGAGREAAVETTGRIPGETRRAILRDLLTSVIGGGVTAGGLGLASALSPTGTTKETGSLAPQGATGAGRYFVSPEVDLSLIPALRADLFRTKLFNLIPGLDMPLPQSVEEVTERLKERSMEQARDLTQREIEKIRAEKAFDVNIQRIIAEAEIAKKRMEAESNIKTQQIASAGAVRQRELQSLGEVQRARLESSYGLARDSVAKALDLLKSGMVTDRTVTTELAKIM